MTTEQNVYDIDNERNQAQAIQQLLDDLLARLPKAGQK